MTNPPNFCWTTVNTLPKVGQALKQRCQCISNRFNLEGLVQQKPALIVLFHFIPIDPENPPVLQFQHWLSMNQQECGRCSQKCPFTGISTKKIMAGCFKRNLPCEDFFFNKKQPNSQPWHPQLDLFSGEFAAYRFIAWFFWWFQKGENMDNHILPQFCHK